MDWTAEKAMAAATRAPDPATRDEISTALQHLVHSARRTFRVVGEPDHPTAWDKIHREIDHRLYLWQMADG